MKIRMSPKIVIMLSLVMLGIALRSVEIINRNYLFGFDQGWNYELVKQIAEKGDLRLIGAEASSGSGFSGVFHGPGYYYILALSYIITGGDPYAGLWVMYLSGILAVFLGAYLALKVFKNSYASYLYVFSVSSCGALISQSRFIWPPHPVTAIVMGIQVLVYLYILAKKEIFILLSLLLAGLIYHFHLALSVPMVLAITLFYFISERGWSRIKSILLSIPVIIFSYAPAILFEMRHRLFLSSIARQPGGAGFSRITNLKYVAEHLRDYWYNFIESFRFLPFLDHIFWKVLFAAFFFLGLAIIAKKIKNPIRRFVHFQLVVIAVTLIFFMGVDNRIWNYYLTNLHLSYIFLFALIIFELQQVKNQNSNLLKAVKIVLVLFIAMFAVNSVSELIRSYTHEIKDYGGGAKIRGKQDLVDFVYKDAAGKKFNIKVFTPPIYTYAFDYVFDWYGQKKYGYKPGRSEKGLTYIIMEPDGSKPWSHKGWLETVVKKGRVVKEFNLPNGFIVQKRIYPN